MENLNKPYFDSLGNECPGLIARFEEWVNKYKIENKWSDLFRNDPDESANQRTFHSIKFYNIPLEMQAGIILLFSIEVNALPQYLHLGIRPEFWAANIRSWFKTVEGFLYSNGKPIYETKSEL